MFDWTIHYDPIRSVTDPAYTQSEESKVDQSETININTPGCVTAKPIRPSRNYLKRNTPQRRSFVHGGVGQLPTRLSGSNDQNHKHQCRKCKYIVGDSFRGIVSSQNPKMKTISLKCLSASRHLHVERDKHDFLDHSAEGSNFVSE